MMFLGNIQLVTDVLYNTGANIETNRFINKAIIMCCVQYSE